MHINITSINMVLYQLFLKVEIDYALIRNESLNQTNLRNSINNIFDIVFAFKNKNNCNKLL